MEDELQYHFQENGCGKKIYPEKIDAVTARNYIRKTRGTELRAYYCDDCKGRHLTKSLEYKQIHKIRL